MPGDPLAFIDAACAPLDAAHASGTLERAEAMLSAHPEIATHDIHTAAILGDEASVRRFLDVDHANAAAKGGPRGWDALTHLCFSKYLRIDRTRAEGFARAARALLDAGASAHTGFFETNHQSEPAWESALYGAAGVAHSPEVTRALLERGADPNDGETVYHSPESYDTATVTLLVETGKLSGDSLSMMLVRKCDWHHCEGVKYLLEHGADPNHGTRRGWRALHHAIARDNSRAIVELLLDHGADPAIEAAGRSATGMAARRGRGDLLSLFEQRGIPIALEGADRLIAACATNDGATIRSIAADAPGAVREVVAGGGKLIAEFAGVGNTDGVRQLLDLGVDVRAPYEGDGYFGIAKDSTALHVAAWKAWHDTVKLLIERGAPVNATDGRGRTPLALAVKACVDSYWTGRRSPESVRALLQAGASMDGVEFPSGYAEVDELLRLHGT